MIPAWKAKREVKRIWLKLYDRLNNPVERLSQFNYDSNFAKHVKLTECAKRAPKKVAIFFIYQPKRFSASIVISCRHLADLGYSTILVSSAPIPAAHKSDLLGLCWKILERPNYGYDFGGFRDGVRVLHDTGVQPENLIIVNDSIWFPLSDTNRMIENLEISDLNFTSPVFENKPGRNRRNQHFQSYLTMIKSTALHSAAFTDYWHTYKVSSKKRIVLLRGEKGFSQAMFKAGFGGNAPSTRAVLFGYLQKQSNAFLHTTLRYAAYTEAELVSDANALLNSYADTSDWRERVLAHMQTALIATQPMGAFCYACIKLLDFSFMKKSSYPLVHDGMRWQYLRAVKNGDLPAPHPIILAEIEASKMDASLTTDPSIPAPVSATKAA